MLLAVLKNCQTCSVLPQQTAAHLLTARHGVGMCVCVYVCTHTHTHTHTGRSVATLTPSPPYFGRLCIRLLRSVLPPALRCGRPLQEAPLNQKPPDDEPRRQRSSAEALRSPCPSSLSHARTASEGVSCFVWVWVRVWVWVWVAGLGGWCGIHCTANDLQLLCMANACHFCLHLGTKCSLKQLLNPNCCALRQSDQLQMPKPERQPPLILHTWQRAFCALLETIALLSISPERGSRKTGSASPELLSRASGQKNKHEGFWLTRETSQTSGEPTKKPKQKHQTLKAHAEANDLMILKPETQTQTNTLSNSNSQSGLRPKSLARLGWPRGSRPRGIHTALLSFVFHTECRAHAPSWLPR